MLRKVAICALLAPVALLAGCGGSDEGTSEEDERAITELVAKVNEATREKDASAFCLLIQPSAIEETFLGIDRCVNETRPILETAGSQPVLEVETVEVDGDVATVTFTGTTSNQASFVREGSQWYLPLDQGEISAAGDDGGED